MSEQPPPYNPSESHWANDKKPSDSEDTSVAASIASSSKSTALLQRSGSSGSKSTFDFLRRKRDVQAVRTAVIEDVRLIVQSNTGSVAERVALLESCAALCARHRIDFASLLQDTSLFHTHTALYWTIVNDLGSPQAPFELVTAILAHSHPLDPKTVKDARRACISLRSQDMLQFLRTRPEFGALSTEDRFILNLVVPPERIDVELMDGPEQPFSVKFHIPMYLKRMLLAKVIDLDFIARGCLWRLSFYTPGSTIPHPESQAEWFHIQKKWGTRLILCENSPRTRLEFGVVVLDARILPAAQSTHSWNHLLPKKPFRNEDEPWDESTTSSWNWPTFGYAYNGDQAYGVFLLRRWS
ncbi:hypothetical protein DFH06DRAFT_1466926 [Mycena polygramma]|nr:hypothetical protein DFH06DRAFT_1466926 [Mycena polygramma]